MSSPTPNTSCQCAACAQETLVHQEDEDYMHLKLSWEGHPMHHGRLRVWVPENCVILNKSKVSINICPVGSSILVTRAEVEQGPPPTRHECEGVTPLLLVFDIYRAGKNVPVLSHCYLLRSSDSQYGKGGGLVVASLEVRGGVIQVTDVASMCAPNPFLEE